ncbi:type VI secretion system protein ImpH [Andreprevotia lacus DSM 23236]|jgi:type VI secretion system protein ImpH|uniref:Type VI secretion system protein ImpH n=1 Tax=Andreprevotia lacus DSM 23236 TaxID=1121001 RepID=A0A1W1Y004_9NEIS|nr:type VI secretion system baseplate subunit TssG [Andreprevotia lacus]SMC29549.1 type VI secretion system protein ImpH [Andreprevotia lacus DSM 23236]
MNAPLMADWQLDPAWQALRQAPYAHDFFHVLRWLDARAGTTEPMGRAARPQDEPVRLGQRVSLSFAPSMVADLQEQGSQPPKLSIYGFGLFGPNGPLPLHLTEYVRERERIADDPTMAAFADLFHHRAIQLFYRAWADAQSTVSLDRAGEGRFDRYIGSLLALLTQSDDAIGKRARYYHAGHLARQTRNPEGLQQILQSYFGIPVQIREHVPCWVKLAPDESLALGNHPSAALGVGSTLGIAVRDAQSRFRLVLGPMSWASYCSFLPGGKQVAALQRWVNDYVGLELAWDVQLVLAADDVPDGKLSAAQPLGLGSWLGVRPARQDAGDLIVDYTLSATRPARRASARPEHGHTHPIPPQAAGVSPRTLEPTQ